MNLPKKVSGPKSKSPTGYKDTGIKDFPKLVTADALRKNKSRDKLDQLTETDADIQNTFDDLECISSDAPTDREPV